MKKVKAAKALEAESPVNVKPVYVMLAEDSPTRRNKAATNERTDRFKNIDNGFIPFTYSGAENKSGLTIRDIVLLCRKAYYNIAIFRNVIDLMTEFSVGKIYWEGGSKKSRDFFKALFSKLDYWSIQDVFYREYYRSGNVFEYRLDGKVTSEDISKMTQVFGIAKQKTVALPIKYIVLNPEDIHLTGTLTFTEGQYHKILTDFELEKLKKPTTEQEKEIFDSLPPEAKKAILSGNGAGVLLPLRSDKLTAVFYKKQDYEPFATPMGYSVLADINWKEEMKRIDMAISRTMQQVILLITMGESKKDGGMGVNQDNINAMQELFKNQSASRILVSDYTTKGQWLIPDIGKFLDPIKYETVNRDIMVGLNYVLFGDDKFANQQTKVKIFTERLKEGRNAFLNKFVIPEVKRISKEIGLKNYPTPYYEEVSLQNDVELARIYTRLAEIGVLTADETIDAINENKLPTREESRESQEEFRSLKDKGYYQPIMNSPFDQLKIAKETAKLKPAPASSGGQNGRPAGSKAPQTTKRVKPMTAFSMDKIKDNMILATELKNEVAVSLKNAFKIKKLSKEQLDIATSVSHLIIANEEPANWKSKIQDYIENPVDKNQEAVASIREIAVEHNIENEYLASILYHSTTECQETE